MAFGPVEQSTQPAEPDRLFALRQRAADDSRRGILTIAPEILLHLLGIPGNHRVEEIRVSAAGNLQIEIVGEDMPEGFTPKPVVLLCTQRAMSDLTGVIEASWEHKPERRWRLR